MFSAVSCLFSFWLWQGLEMEFDVVWQSRVS